MWRENFYRGERTIPGARPAPKQTTLCLKSLKNLRANSIDLSETMYYFKASQSTTTAVSPSIEVHLQHCFHLSFKHSSSDQKLILFFYINNSDTNTMFFIYVSTFHRKKVKHLFSEVGVCCRNSKHGLCTSIISCHFVLPSLIKTISKYTH